MVHCTQRSIGIGAACGSCRFSQQAWVAGSAGRCCRFGGPAVQGSPIQIWVEGLTATRTCCPAPSVRAASRSARRTPFWGAANLHRRSAALQADGNAVKTLAHTCVAKGLSLLLLSETASARIPLGSQANGNMVKILIHTDVTKYLEFKSVDGSFVFNKARVEKVGWAAQLAATCLGAEQGLRARCKCKPWVAGRGHVGQLAWPEAAAGAHSVQLIHGPLAMLTGARHGLGGAQEPADGPVREAAGSQVLLLLPAVRRAQPAGVGACCGQSWPLSKVARAGRGRAAAAAVRVTLLAGRQRHAFVHQAMSAPCVRTTPADMAQLGPVAHDNARAVRAVWAGRAGVAAVVWSLKPLPPLDCTAVHTAWAVCAGALLCHCCCCAAVVLSALLLLFLALLLLLALLLPLLLLLLHMHVRLGMPMPGLHLLACLPCPAGNQLGQAMLHFSVSCSRS